jgi:hypothetical protein
MNEVAKKKVKAIVIVFLVVVSSIAIYVVLDRLNIFSSPSKPVMEQNESLEEEVLNPTAIKVTELMQQLDESMIRSYIEKLTSFGPHPTAHRLLYKLSNRPIIGKFFDLPIEKVARYIYNEFESYGLKVRYQYWEEEPTIKNLTDPSWYFGWNVGNNVEATLPGTNESSDEIYVLVAHYDTWPNTPGNEDDSKIVGANDDSSGVALLLAAAKLMSQYSFDHTVRFVAVDGEEQWLKGSRAYAEEAVKNNDNIVAAFGIDMIGNRGVPDYRNTEVLFAGYKESSWIVNFTRNVNKRYSEFLNFTIFWDEVTLGNFKDHGSDYQEFLKHGYDAVYVAEAVEDYDLHRNSDTIENMDTSYTTEISRLILATAAELAWDVEYG